MATLVHYERDDTVATVTLDDGKVNVLSLGMQAELHAALDRAQSDGLAVLIEGRPGVFSAGFDLKTLQAGGGDAAAMVIGGFELSERLLSYPSPVVMACTGHAMAMGLFLLLSGDYRVGSAGPFRFQANEVVIGLAMPRSAVEIMRQRISTACLGRVVALAEAFDPSNAVAAGILDSVVDATEVRAQARAMAESAATLDRAAHGVSKQRVRRPALEALRAAIEADAAELGGRV